MTRYLTFISIPPSSGDTSNLDHYTLERKTQDYPHMDGGLKTPQRNQVTNVIGPNVDDQKKRTSIGFPFALVENLILIAESIPMVGYTCWKFSGLHM